VIDDKTPGVYVIGCIPKEVVRNTVDDLKFIITKILGSVLVTV